MSSITTLEPRIVWEQFDAITQIPRPSKKEGKIIAFLVDFAKRHGLEYRKDAIGNVVICKPATPGFEQRPTVVLQSHMDMVCEKNSDVEFDFEKDAIRPYIDGEWVTADGTTLGADDGIGVAAILAVLEDNTLRHGPVEALFTATEETGMDGAFGLEEHLLQGDILLNLDSETEGELYVGCAGGLDANITFDYEAEPVPAACEALRIVVKGLKGGHSGIQIGCQRANANKLLFRFIGRMAADEGMLLASVDGGGLRNAIPREAEAVVLLPAGRSGTVIEALKHFEQVVVAEFAGIEDSIEMHAEPCALPERMIARAVGERLVRAVLACPDGVRRMSMSMPGLVQTSSNLARVVSDGRTVRLQSLLRSSVNSEKEELGQAFEALFTLAGARVELTGSYDG